MHYRNGREEKNGDKIVKLEGGKVVAYGVYCNGNIAVIQPANDYACMRDCLHVDDVAEVLKEKELDKKMDDGIPAIIRSLEQQQCDMRPDDTLRTACTDACRGATDAKRQKIEQLWDDYEAACRLSRGRDPQRSAYWEFKAKTIERDLQRIVKPWK